MFIFVSIALRKERNVPLDCVGTTMRRLLINRARRVVSWKHYKWTLHRWSGNAFLWVTNPFIVRARRNHHRWSEEENSNAHHRLIADYVEKATTQKATKIAAGKHHGTSIGAKWFLLKSFYVVSEDFFVRFQHRLPKPILRDETLCSAEDGMKGIIHLPLPDSRDY